MRKFTNTRNQQEGGFLKKGIVALLFATLAGSLTFGAAASLGLTANDLGAGTTVVAACDSDGINIEWVGLQVYEANLTDVDNRCDGQLLTFTLWDSTDFTGTFAQFSMTIPFDASNTVVVPTLVGGNPLDSASIAVAQLTINGAPNL